MLIKSIDQRNCSFVDEFYCIAFIVTMRIVKTHVINKVVTNTTPVRIASDNEFNKILTINRLRRDSTVSELKQKR